MIDEKTIKYGDTFRWLKPPIEGLFMFICWSYDSDATEGKTWVGISLTTGVFDVARRRGFASGVLWEPAE